MPIHDSVLESIGHTPLIRLKHIGKDLPATLLVKDEAQNPGGSIKDRIALRMIEAAEREGVLRVGSTIVEATAGNTGLGIAQVAAVKGYKCVFVVPDKMSDEKIAVLRAFGTEVIVTRTAVAPDSPENYNVLAQRIARETPGAFVPSQFTNLENPRAHYLSTGPEIWNETGGEIVAFVAGVGTGGTVSGCGRYLKEKNSNVKVIVADPLGSILSGGDGSPWIVEGIGEDFFPKTFDKALVDEYIAISDQESFRMARRLAREEGLLVGGSSGTALAAALKYAERTRAPGNIVVMLPDTGRNYLSKCHSDAWMKEQGFLEERGGR